MYIIFPCWGSRLWVLPIVIWAVPLGAEAVPRLGQGWMRRQQQLGVMGFGVDTWNRKQTGLRWGRGPISSSSPSSKKGQPQQVPHPDWISALKHPSLPPSLLPHIETTKQSGLSEQKTKFAPGQLHFSSESASTMLSPRQHRFQ